MRHPNPEIEQYRIDGPTNEPIGHFVVPIKLQFSKFKYGVIVGNGGGWDHVSVSHPLHCPHWNVMAAIKKLWFGDDETVMELHVPASIHINQHPNCLHLWRPQTDDEIAFWRKHWGNEWCYGDLKSPGTIPLPPLDFV